MSFVLKKAGLQIAQNRKNTGKLHCVQPRACSNPCAENILSACEKNGIRGLEVNILFTDDQSIRNINREYREIDSSTDVLSFPINDFSYGTGEIQPYNVDENSFLLLLGDIVVSLPAMKHQAEEYGHSVERECAFLICHGMCSVMTI